MNVKKRSEWALKYQNGTEKDLENVRLSDEAPFAVFRNKARERVCRPKGERIYPGCVK